MGPASNTRPVARRRILAGWLLISLAVGAAALPGIDRLGLYYDEAFLAQQARDFVGPAAGGTHPASVRSVTLWDRPFPVRNAVYLGSLKSQLLIPALAWAGSSPRVVRTATLATALLALLLAMLWAARLFGEETALLMGVLVASDPTFYFFSQFEWGPFTTNFLCRSAAALAAVMAWRSASPARAIAGAVTAGAFLGLGVFSRADFILIPAAAAIALGLCRPDLVRQMLVERRGALIGFAAAFSLAALPMITSLAGLLGSASVAGQRGDLFFRARVLWQSLDGSHFLRLMESGGLFERAAQVDAPSGLLGWMILPAAAVLMVDGIRKYGRRALNAPDPRAFLLVFSLLLTTLMLALPGAVRAHHQLNTLPLLHLIVASAALTLWRREGGWGTARIRLGIAVLLTGTAVANLVLIHRTTDFIDTTGGRGRWSHALSDFARELNARPGEAVVSLEWGFHEPLLFLTRDVPLEESTWALSRSLASGQPWVRDADAGTTYLVHDSPYDLFGLGPRFLMAARVAGPEIARIRSHEDGAGEPAFYSVRVLGPHRVHYDGAFRIR